MAVVGEAVEDDARGLGPHQTWRASTPQSWIASSDVQTMTSDAPPSNSYDRGSTTEPDTPDSTDCDTSPYVFARLIPTNRPARGA
jgi:hypothetical protein